MRAHNEWRVILGSRIPPAFDWISRPLAHPCPGMNDCFAASSSHRLAQTTVRTRTSNVVEKEPRHLPTQIASSDLSDSLISLLFPSNCDGLPPLPHQLQGFRLFQLGSHTGRSLLARWHIHCYHVDGSSLHPAHVCATRTSSTTPSAAAAAPFGPRPCPAGASPASAARRARSRARSPSTTRAWPVGSCARSRRRGAGSSGRACGRRTARCEGSKGRQIMRRGEGWTTPLGYDDNGAGRDQQGQRDADLA